MGAGAAAALLPVIADALATLIATGVGTSVGSGSGGKVVAGGTAAGVELYNRQLHPDEQKLLEKQAKELAKEKGISEEEATRRLAEAFAFYTDADWQAVIAGKAEIDSATLIHLGLALAPLGSRYDVVAIEGDVPSVGMPDSKTYTAAETLRLLQNYQLTHAAAFNNPLINSEYLVSLSPENLSYQLYYAKYLNYGSEFNPAADTSGAMQGIGAAVGQAKENIFALGKSLIQDFAGTSSQLVNGALQSAAQPDQMVQAFNQARTEAEAQAYLYRLQGGPEAAAKVEMEWATELALNLVGTRGGLARSGQLVDGAGEIVGLKKAPPNN